MWEHLKTEHARVKDRPIPDLFQTDGRAQDFSVTAGDMVFDYSKTNIDADTRDALIDMVNTARVAEKRDAMFAGAPINDTEGRAVLHTALRNLDGRAIKTQLGNPQIVPTENLAQELAQEWDAQGTEIDPASFRYRDMADFALDMVAPNPAEQVTKLLILPGQLAELELDPLQQTADTDRSNNYYPRRILPSRLELFKQERESRNLMKENYTQLKGKTDADDGSDVPLEAVQD